MLQEQEGAGEGRTGLASANTMGSRFMLSSMLSFIKLGAESPAKIDTPDLDGKSLLGLCKRGFWQRPPHLLGAAAPHPPP